MYDLSVSGWASARASHLSIQIDTHDAFRAGGPAPLQNLARLLPQGASGLSVRCQVGGQSVTVHTDQNGQARCEVPTTGAVTVSLANGEEVKPNILSVPDAPITIISDLDDTVLITGAGQRSALSTFLNATVSNRAAFADIAPLYNSFAAHGYSLVYLSNSPLGLSNFLRLVLPARSLPNGPLLLRPLNVQTLLHSTLHKSQSLSELAADLPGQFVLIGDTAQQDPEVYSAFAQSHPNKVLGIAIRDVSGQPRRQEVAALMASAGVPVVISSNAADFASLLR